MNKFECLKLKYYLNTIQNLVSNYNGRLSK